MGSLLGCSVGRPNIHWRRLQFYCGYKSDTKEKNIDKLHLTVGLNEERLWDWAVDLGQTQKDLIIAPVLQLLWFQARGLTRQRVIHARRMSFITKGGKPYILLSRHGGKLPRSEVHIPRPLQQ